MLEWKSSWDHVCQKINVNDFFLFDIKKFHYEIDGSDFLGCLVDKSVFAFKYNS